MTQTPKILADALGEPEMDDLEQRFVEEYCVDLNHKNACIRCGIKSDKAAATGRRLMRKPEVLQAIDVRLAELSRHTVLNAEWVRSKMKEVAERCMQAVPVMEKQKNDDGQWEMVPTGEFKFDSNGANKALENLGKHLGMFSEKLEDDRMRELKGLTAEQLDERIKRLMEEHSALTLEMGSDGVFRVPVSDKPAAPALVAPAEEPPSVH